MKFDLPEPLGPMSTLISPAEFQLLDRSDALEAFDRDSFEFRHNYFRVGCVISGAPHYGCQCPAG